MNEPLDEKTKAELDKQGLIAVSKRDSNALSYCFMASFLLTIATVIASFYWHLVTPDNITPLLLLLLAPGIFPAIITGLLKRSVRKGLGVLYFSLLPPVMIGAMIAFSFGTTLANEYNSAPNVVQFVQTDFDIYDTTHTGQVRSADLSRVLDEQKALRDEKTRLTRLGEDLTSLRQISAAAKQQLQASLDLALKSVEAKTLSQDEISRLSAAREAVWRCGSVVPMTQAELAKTREVAVYSADRRQLSGFRQFLEGKYPNWIRLLHRFGAI